MNKNRGPTQASPFIQIIMFLFLNGNAKQCQLQVQWQFTTKWDLKSGKAAEFYDVDRSDIGIPFKSPKKSSTDKKLVWNS